MSIKTKKYPPMIMTVKDLLKSTSKISILFNRYLPIVRQKTTSQLKRSYRCLHTNFKHLLFLWVSCKEVHTKSPHTHPSPNDSLFLTTMVI